MSPKEEGNVDSFNTFPRPGGIELVAPPLAFPKSGGWDLDAEHFSLDDPDYEKPLLRPRRPTNSHTPPSSTASSHPTSVF